MTFFKYTKDFLSNPYIKDISYGYKMVAYGYDGAWDFGMTKVPVKKVRKKVVKFKVTGDNLDFLNYLDDKYVVQIENTFYRKSGASFVYEYLNQSGDYQDNLVKPRDMEISIMLGGGLLG